MLRLGRQYYGLGQCSGMTPDGLAVVVCLLTFDATSFVSLGVADFLLEQRGNVERGAQWAAGESLPSSADFLR
jgi:hypothetical protein